MDLVKQLRLSIPVLWIVALVPLAGTGCDPTGPPPGGGAGLWIEQTHLSLLPGDTGTLSARFKETDRSSADSVEGGVWSSSDPAVVAVEAEGRIEAVGAGRAVVSLTYMDRTDSTPVRVRSRGEGYRAWWTRVSVGETATCALNDAGAAYCWGWDFFGNMGRGYRRMFSGVHAPAPVSGNHTFAELSVGDVFACGIDGEGVLRCWGDGLAVGVRGGDPVLAPERMPWEAPLHSLATGFDHGCALEDSGAPVCWGNTGPGQGLLAKPAAVPTDVRLAALGAGFRYGPGSFTCGIDGAGQVWCWGSWGVSEDGVRTSPLPTLVPWGATAERLAASGNACLTSTSGQTACWGDNRHRQLIGETDYVADPTPLPSGKQFEHTAPGPAATCGLTSSGEAYCWGSDEFGNLGNSAAFHDACSGKEPCSAVPVPVDGEHRFTQISSDLRTTCGVTVGGAIYCWGSNRFGKLGTGSLISGSAEPVRVADPVSD